MGLPLFIAKLESDLPNKASGKHDVLAPSNAGVQSNRNRNRRMYADDSGPTLREARWQFEQTRLRRDSHRRRARQAMAGDSIQVVAAPSPPTASDLEAVFGPQDDAVDSAMDEFLRLNSQSRGRYADRLHDLLGHRWTSDGLRARARILNLRNARANSHAHLLAETTYPLTDARSRPPEPLVGWSTEPRPQARRARVVSPNPLADDSLSPEDSLALQGVIESMRRERRRADGAALRRNRTARQQRGIDGLGDRQRSMSPEMWDTLLSTMTPDPEPPSVSSSFASFPTTQSQNTNATSFPAPDSGARTAEGFVSEPPCDSGCENSDPEQDGPSSTAQAAEDRRRSRASLEGPFVRRRLEANNLRRTPVSGEGAANSVPSAFDFITAPLGLPRSQSLRVGWVGQLSVGASDEPGAREENSQEANTRAPHSHSEDDWSGMQLIVRRLARREDIPDEWWLEAGLSRNLGDDAEMQ
ncbi:hypothetical protein NLU13_5593 [Sarocladium strictum]|uniref:Uncharacterized protein n=1 Tax=Sarocladium strictum TaxID=5046 RepID=A0AA39GH68_SARSR|nr:hypothetical protein NLU13_5593 [Sarocladium strictum]